MEHCIRRVKAEPNEVDTLYYIKAWNDCMKTITCFRFPKKLESIIAALIRVLRFFELKYKIK